MNDLKVQRPEQRCSYGQDKNAWRP
jgi:hypothetical protein